MKLIFSQIALFELRFIYYLTFCCGFSQKCLFSCGCGARGGALLWIWPFRPTVYAFLTVIWCLKP